MAGPGTRPNGESAEILARVEPGRLDSLWLEILASDYGRTLLNAWDLTLEQARECRPAIAGMAEDVVLWANRLTCLTYPAPFECAEYMLCGLLATGQSALCRALRAQGKDVGALLDELTEELWLDPARSKVDLHDWYLKAYRQGRDKPYESECLEVCAEASTRVGRWLARNPVSPEQLHHTMEHPADWVVEFLEPVHLAMAMALRWLEIVHWMERLGVTASRLHFTINALDLRLSNEPVTGEKMRWLKPASEEARLLNAPVVTPQHLLLGLMTDPEGLTCRLMRQNGVDVRTLRRQISAFHQRKITISEMAFSSELIEICQEAAERDGADPHPGEFLDLVLDALSLGPESLRADLKVRLRGSLTRDTHRISLDGVSLGFSAEEVLERCGPPLSKIDGTWYYDDRLVVALADERVKSVTGRRLQQDGTTILELHAGLDEVDRTLGFRHWVVVDGGAFVWGMVRRGHLTMMSLSAKSEEETED